MPNLCPNSITSARDSHIGSLKSCVVRKRRSAESPVTPASAKSRAMSSRMLFSSCLDVLCFWTSLFASNCVQLTFASFDKLLWALQHCSQEMIVLLNPVSEFIYRIDGCI